MVLNQHKIHTYRKQHTPLNRRLALTAGLLISQFAFCIRTEAQEAVYLKISAEQAYQMMSELDDYILLDVRTEEEYLELRIEGAVLIPDNEIRSRAQRILPDKNKPLFVYCRSGVRSERAAKTLVSLGYINVYDFGGIVDWLYGTVSGL